MVLDLHPFIESFSHSGVYNNLPPQMIPYSKKVANSDKRGISPWMKACMDTFEVIGRYQYNENRKLLENEKLLNGEFIPQDYIDCEDCDEDFLDPIKELIKEGGFPRFLKHYDMIRAIIMTEVEEFSQLPDTFHVISHGEQVENDKRKIQGDLLKQYISEQLELQFKIYLEQQGVDINQQFETEEEQQQFQQKIDQMRKERTPQEIGRYMRYEYRHFAEEWAEFELQDQKDRFNFSKLRRREFLNLLSVGRRFRHIRISNRGLSIEPLNWYEVFYQKSKVNEYVQDGEYGGKIYKATSSYIIDRFGDYLSEEEIKSFEYYANLHYEKETGTTDMFGNPVQYTSLEGNPYNSWMPSYTPHFNKIAPNLGLNWVSSLVMPEEDDGDFLTHNWQMNRYIVTESYWRSYEQVGRLNWNNPVTGLHEIILVDESFIVPKWIKVIKEGDFNSEQDINTIVWTWREQLWEGVKINNYNLSSNTSPIYIKIKPCDYQSSPSLRFYGKKLPIAGQVLLTNQVNLLKSYQFIYNIVMNKAVKYLERSLMAFVAMDINMLPNQKGWGGEDALFKWLGMGEESGAAPVDTSPSNTQGANSGGHFPQVIDLDLTPKIISFFNMANSIRALAMSQLGFSPPRLGDIGGIDTATGINASITKSHNATGSWFSDFWECERDILKMQLDAAQYLQSNGGDFNSLLSKGIISESYLYLNNNDFSLYDLRIYVTNSQEELRQIEMFKKLAIENNTLSTLMSTRLDMISLNNAQLIKQIVKEEEEKALKMQQAIQEREAAFKEAQLADSKEQRAWEKEKHYSILDNNQEVAWIRSRGYLSPGEQDLDNSGTPDALEYAKFEAKAANNLDKSSIDREKLLLEKDKERARRNEQTKRLDLEYEKLKLAERQMIQTAKNVKYLDKGKYKSS